MRERERIRTEKNLDKVINGINITEARHEKLKCVLKNEFGVTWRDIISKKRNAQIVRARRNYYHIMRYIFLYTLEDIGYLTNKTHCTVIHNLKIHERYMEIYPEEKYQYKKIKKVMLERVTSKELKERVKFLESQKSIIQQKIDELSMNKKRINELITNK
tara:strand:- start:753 stop:1232 length:480 start_codon:yes stop_codon:yes gene_type:complete